MNAAHLRLKYQDLNKKGDMVECFDKRVLTIVHNQLEPSLDHEPCVAIGWSFSHSKKGWNRKKAWRIAKARCEDSPIRFRFEGLTDDLRPLTRGEVVSTVKAYLLDQPEWHEIDDQVFKPSRFEWRVHGEMIGPSGSLVHVYVDTKSGIKEPDQQVIQMMESAPGADNLAEFTHWALKKPSWVNEYLEELG